ncbi:OmpA/MotB family protein [Sneathiella limimaris]|uniref:OmpA/MotB family protein n=1 Tax=Sneathiella limimaris TaxID=1964213 RepID=UPI00146C5929|nr:flagellar motor protein MotB [Sneathiella limimaris]
MFEPLPQPTNRRQNTMWLTSLADLLALLLAFFVLVFAMNEIKRDNWEKVLEFLGNPLNINSEQTETGPTAEENVELFTEQRAFDLDYLQNILKAKVSSSEELTNVEVFKAADRLIISFIGDSFFGQGGNDVTGKLLDATRMLGETLRYVKNRIEVYGHSDPVPIQNRAPDALSNWTLSLSRAVSVSETLEKAGYGYPVQVYGLADSRYFELDPSNGEEKNFQLARRIDIVIREAKGANR